MSTPITERDASSPRVAQFSVATFGNTVLMASVTRDICDTIVFDEATGQAKSRITIIEHEVPMVPVTNGEAQ